MFTMSFILLFTLFVFSITVRVCEYHNPFFNFKDTFNSIWFVMVTMVTIGYGDYIPVTVTGRLISFLLSIWGLLIVYLTALILSE